MTQENMKREHVFERYYLWRGLDAVVDMTGDGVSDDEDAIRRLRAAAGGHDWTLWHQVGGDARLVAIRTRGTVVIIRGVIPLVDSWVTGDLVVKKALTSGGPVGGDAYDETLGGPVPPARTP